MTAPLPLSRTTPKQTDEAVSPVIGVILMVAVTVVLAAVIFVIVAGIGNTPNQAPVVQFVRDNMNGQLTVVKAFRPVDLTEVEIRAGEPAQLGYNAQPTVNMPAGTYVPISPTPGTILAAGDQLNFCSLGTAEKVDITVRVTSPDNVVVYQNFFTNLNPC